VAGATGVAAARSIGMAIGTVFAAIGLAVFHDRRIKGNDAGTGIASTFYLGNSCHGWVSNQTGKINI